MKLMKYLNNMKKKNKLLFPIMLCAILLANSCHKGVDTPGDIRYLNSFHLENFADDSPALKMNDVALYVDYSTCMKLGQNSEVCQDLCVSLYSEENTKHYWSIKGNDIQEEDLSVCSVYERLRTIEEVDYANLKTAAEMIVESNSESILLTDGEYILKNMAKGHDNDPYLSSAFKKWILRGYDIHIIAEPYNENYNGKDYSKKRFYFIFTDDRQEENIFSHIERTGVLSKYPEVKHFHLSASNPYLFGEGKTNSSLYNEILNSKVKGYGNYEIVDWKGCDWGTIEKMIVNALDEKTGNPLPNGSPILTLSMDKNSFGCYSIKSLNVRVYDVNEKYMAYYQCKQNKGKCPQYSTSDLTELENFMLVDNKKFEKKGEVNLLFNQAWFDPSQLEGIPNNYLKVDIAINEVRSVFDNVESFFEFESIIRPGEKNVSVASSIKQCIIDTDVLNKIRNQIIYSIYIKSESK